MKKSGAKRLIDVRLNNVSQLAGFTKKNDLTFFVKTICDMEYLHVPDLAPTKEMLNEYKKGGGDWATYEKRFLDLMGARKVEKLIPKYLLDDGCMLCSEHLPHQCHRRLVAEYFDRHQGPIEVCHLT